MNLVPTIIKPAAYLNNAWNDCLKSNLLNSTQELSNRLRLVQTSLQNAKTSVNEVEKNIRFLSALNASLSKCLIAVDQWLWNNYQSGLKEIDYDALSELVKAQELIVADQIEFGQTLDQLLPVIEQFVNLSKRLNLVSAAAMLLVYDPTAKVAKAPGSGVVAFKGLKDATLKQIQFLLDNQNLMVSYLETTALKVEQKDYVLSKGAQASLVTYAPVKIANSSGFPFLILCINGYKNYVLANLAQYSQAAAAQDSLTMDLCRKNIVDCKLVFPNWRQILAGADKSFPQASTSALDSMYLQDFYNCFNYNYGSLKSLGIVLNQTTTLEQIHAAVIKNQPHLKNASLVQQYFSLLQTNIFNFINKNYWVWAQVYNNLNNQDVVTDLSGKNYSYMIKQNLLNVNLVKLASEIVKPAELTEVPLEPAVDLASELNIASTAEQGAPQVIDASSSAEFNSSVAVNSESDELDKNKPEKSANDNSTHDDSNVNEHLDQITNVINVNSQGLMGIDFSGS